MPYLAQKRAILSIVLGALFVLAPAPLAARDWSTKTVVPSTNVSACPGSLTVAVSWDKKGGPVATVDFHLYVWDTTQLRYFLVTDSVGGVPDAKDSASQTFSGLAAGSYTFTAFLWSANGTTVGVYDGTQAANSNVTC